MTLRLAVLRPEPGNAATAARALAAGFAVTRLPLFAVRALDWTPPDPADYDALVLTSANAVRMAGAGLAGLKALPVLAVGEQTAAAARAAGFAVIAVGSGDADALAALAGRHGIARALHLAGRERIVMTAGPVSRTIDVYTSDPVVIAPACLGALTGAVALLHSVRAARRLGMLVDAHPLDRATIRVAAFSAAIADLAGPGWGGMAIGVVPTDAALFATIRARYGDH